MHVINTEVDLLANEVIEIKKQSIFLIHQRIIDLIHKLLRVFKLNPY